MQNAENRYIKGLRLSEYLIKKKLCILFLKNVLVFTEIKFLSSVQCANQTPPKLNAMPTTAEQRIHTIG